MSSSIARPSGIQLAGLETTPPRHVAIIMDGNGRWAQSQGLSRVEGHAEGARAVRETVRECRAQGVEYLTLYAFSVANWSRPRDEVKALMGLLLDFAEKEKHELRDQGVKLQVIGELEELPIATRHAVERASNFTSDCTDMTLSLALSYGGRADIVNAARHLAVQIRNGELLPEEVTQQTLQQSMSTHNLPAVDLLIRTGGERRVSDFLLFESAYAELYFLPLMWPEFDRNALREAFAYFSGRERRFGLTGAQVEEAIQKTGKGTRSFDPLDATHHLITDRAANAE